MNLIGEIPFRRSAFGSLVTILFLIGNAGAQLPGAKVNFIFPPSGQAGTSLEVALDGSDLNGAEGLKFSHSGISGTPVMTAGDEFLKRPQWQRNRFNVTIAADVPPGVYHAWFVGRYGISNSRSFVVGDLPQPAEVGGNDTHEKAKAIELNSIVVGRADAAKPDCFRITLKAGQQVVFDCQAERLGSRLDAALAIYDSTGKELARSRGDRGRDPVVGFKAPADGAYVVEISDFLSTGGADRFFRLVVTDRPYIESIFPPAGVPGTKSSHTILGHNLPGGVEQLALEIDIPNQVVTVDGAFAIRPREYLGAGFNYQFQNSNTIRIPFASAPVVIEDAASERQKVAVPCEVAGHFSTKSDLDEFEFDARKGEQFFIEAISHRAGHATDLHLKVLRQIVAADGKRSEQKVGESDDDANKSGGRRAAIDSRDPLLAFTAPEDGAYVVRLADQFQLDDPRASYRLSIRRPVPDFLLMADIENPRTDGKRLENWSSALLRGGRMKIEVWALRRDGFDGEITLGVQGAPAGIEVSAGRIEKGKTNGQIIVSGGAELAKGVSDLKIVGTSGELSRDAYRIALSREVGDYDNEEVIPEMSQSLLLASRDGASPLAIGIEAPPVIQTSLGGTVEIPVKVTKDGDFKGAAKFFLDGMPNIKKRPELSLDLNKVVDGRLSIPLKPTNENKYAAGKYEVSVRGDTVLQFRPDPAAVIEATEDQKAVELLVAPAGEALKLAAAKQAEIAQSSLTDEEKKTHTAAADEAIAKAQARVTAVAEAKKRAAERLKQANERNKPRDLPIVGLSRSLTLEIAAAPLRFKTAPPAMEVAKGAKLEVPVEIERLFGFADAVELSLVPPKDLKGFALKPVTVAKDQTPGKLEAGVTAEAPEGEHAFSIQAKMTFNGVACTLAHPLIVKVVGASRLPEEPGAK